MANTKNAIKAHRQSERRRTENRYYAKTTRNAIRDIRAKGKDEAAKDLPKVIAMIDKLAKKKVIHKNKAANLKSQLMRPAAPKQTAPVKAAPEKAAAE
jgi:small subunit ribosomal protein S20